MPTDRGKGWIEYVIREAKSDFPVIAMALDFERLAAELRWVVNCTTVGLYGHVYDKVLH